MDFFERWFQFSPDGGNGTLEAVYLVILAGVISAVVFHHAIRGYFRRTSRSSSGRS